MAVCESLGPDRDSFGFADQNAEHLITDQCTTYNPEPATQLWPVVAKIPARPAIGSHKDFKNSMMAC